MAAAAEEIPFHLRGNYAPVESEVTAHDLAVEGSIPPELRGLYLRNGPNPREATPHWFMGEGMIHGIRLEGGRAVWYRNRWVRGKAFTEGANFVDDEGNVDFDAGVANTNVVGHAGRILALVESSFPHCLTPELETVGPFSFDGKLTSAMTAHPKLCPLSGEMHLFGYGFAPPFLVYHRVDAGGKLVQSETIEVPGPTMMHDFAITDRHVIFMDLPIVFSPEALAEGGMPYQWSDDYGARLGLMERGASGDSTRWFEIEPCYVFHPMNAHENNGRVVLDVARYPELWRESASDFARAYPHRFEIDLASGGVHESALDDRSMEFPRVDPRREGLPNRFGYGVTARPDEEAGDGPGLLIKYDLESGETRVHDFGAGRHPGEGVFVPAGPDAGEDEGWVMTYLHDDARGASEFVILDAQRFEAPPVARVALPQRVPYGFHGNWVADPA